jgi:CDP-paratose 2-epimerase
MTALIRDRIASARPVLVTGGCGFIGCNIADALVARGQSVLIFDSMARNGAQENAHWLKSRHGDRIEIRTADIRDGEAVDAAVGAASAVLHLAAQVAVTTSVERPVEDFEINARGTLNVLEAVRLKNPDVPLLFASTNKVYGRLFDEKQVTNRGQRYVPTAKDYAQGVGEQTPLDLYSPYGCSKGAAEQYVRDYSRVFGLRTAVMRMSCIYGPRQFGTEDQGWIAHFILQAIRRDTITIYGDGLQVRDALHIDDAVAAWLSVLDRIETLAGRIFNLGGGVGNAISLLELLDLIAQLRGEAPRIAFGSWRPGDQPWYVSDCAALKSATGWQPRIALPSGGLKSLIAWLEQRFGADMPRPAIAGAHS